MNTATASDKRRKTDLNKIVFALGKFNPAHLGHIKILGGALKEYALQGIPTFLFISRKSNLDILRKPVPLGADRMSGAIKSGSQTGTRVGDIQHKMNALRQPKGSRGPGYSHPEGGYGFTKIPAVDDGKPFDPATTPVKGQAIPSTQNSIYDRIHGRGSVVGPKHVNIEEFNDTPLAPELKKKILDHVLNYDIEKPEHKIKIEFSEGLWGIKSKLLAAGWNKDVKLIMIAGSDRVASYSASLEAAGYSNFEIVQAGADRPDVEDRYSGKTLRHLAHEAADELGLQFVRKRADTPKDATPEEIIEGYFVDGAGNRFVNIGENVFETPSGKQFLEDTGYMIDPEDAEGLNLTLEAINQINRHIPRGGRRKTKKKYRKKNKTKKGRKRRVKTKRKRIKRKNKSRRRS